MKAVVIEEPGKVAVQSVEDPTPGEMDAIVKVDACGICGTDLHVLHGEFAPTRYPIIPGHEFCGEVVAVGSSVRNISTGDFVAVDPSLFCGHCKKCRLGRFNLCENWNAVGVGSVNGASAEFVKVQSGSAFRVDADYPRHWATLVEPLSCAVHGLDQIEPKPANEYLIYGAGTMGLLLAQLVKHNGAGGLDMVETNPARRALAKWLAADRVAVTDTTAPAATVIVGQRLPGSDPQFFDFSRLPVYVDIDVSGPGGEFQTTGLVSDAADWSATGNGIATSSFPALADGAYVVRARFAPALFPYPGIEFMTGEDARVALASSPSQRGFAGGGGAIAADPSANTADPHGYFGFELKPGRTLQGNLVYMYRSRIDVGGGTLREVDVIVTSTDLTSLTGNQQTASASGHFSVAFIDSLTGVHYGAFELSGGAFTLNVSDGATKTANGFALELSRPDGTLFHTSAPLDARGQVPLVPAVLGNIVCNL